MHRDTTALWNPVDARQPSGAARRESLSLTEGDIRTTTNEDQVPRVLVRMLTSLGALLLSAVIVVCIHLYARSAMPADYEDYAKKHFEGNGPRPDPRIVDETLPPSTPNAPEPTPPQEPVTEEETRTTRAIPTTHRSTATTKRAQESSSTRTPSLGGSTASKGTQTHGTKTALARRLSPRQNATVAAKGENWRPLGSFGNNGVVSADDGKDGQDCTAVHMSFCSNASKTWNFFYDPKERACLSATSYRANVCNRSPNQFSSREACLAACAHVASSPEPRCSERPNFVPCGPADARYSWWFHDGKKCAPWGFNGGRCPSASAPVFGNAAECFAVCSKPGTRQELGCLLPQSQLCEPRQLRHPFFAAPSSSGGFECFEATPDFLLRHRCLLGRNRFSSSDECAGKCLQPAG